MAVPIVEVELRRSGAAVVEIREPLREVGLERRVRHRVQTNALQICIVRISLLGPADRLDDTPDRLDPEDERPPQLLLDDTKVPVAYFWPSTPGQKYARRQRGGSVSERVSE